MPKWLDNAVFYEIYPQTFNDTNADGIGDIQGIIEKLDYVQGLGCTAIWINPWFVSPFGDAGYDVQDYMMVAPRYGTNQDAVRLFEEVHRRGMHILLDLVPGHTSDQHKWFKESCKADRNEYTDRYVWTDAVFGPLPETLPGQFPISVLRGFAERDGCAVLNFFSCQPALNYGYVNPTMPWQQPTDAPGPKATIEAMKDVMRFWLGLGCDGFRVDMAGSLVKNDLDGQGTIGVWKQIRAFLDEEFPDAAMVSEWGEPNKSLEGGFHMDFLLHFGPSHYNDLFRCDEPYFSSRAKGSIRDFVDTYQMNYDKTNGKGLICIPCGNHDMDRLARRLSGDELKVVFGFLMSMPGAPFIYNGDEIGMRFVDGLKSVEGGYNRTGSRTPMQWDSSTNAGFSSAPKEKLYIQQDPAKDRPTVEKQMADPDSLYNEIKKLIGIRQANIALQSRARIEYVNVGYPLVYSRTCPEQKLLVIVNPSAEATEFPYAGPIGEAVYAFNGKVTAANGKVTVPPQSFGYYNIG